jgi:acetylglutamate kinase
VVASIGVGTDGQIYNINADTVAGELAAALQAEKIVFVSDVGGIVSSVDLEDEEAHAVMRVISECTLAELGALQAAGGITGGMIPKVNAVRRALESGVTSAHIIDGRVEHALLLEILTDAGCGTKVSCDALGPAVLPETSLYSRRGPVRGLSGLSGIVARHSEGLAAGPGSPCYQALVG